ncbi:hypothetical protein H7I53_14510 [Mycolicibacterium pulveris]|uniref:Uncharacterized protein n=2 Tax=Mycolicibacterium pulveris TaxID=36813 RepID=A0A7I7UNI1_MYCPV|nr:hypothetical protein [Mycolicibacterium pulveris]MCV6981434.1 hypothetical protein [Mycolicibacterium pulveris]BBY82109.1 hypothetical protein MPUL_32670 [Mycolicibacterium pulveris]
MRYFTDGTGLVARVLTDAPFGPEFSQAQAQTYSAKQDDWKDAPGLTTEIRFSGDWSECEGG